MTTKRRMLAAPALGVAAMLAMAAPAVAAEGTAEGQLSPVPLNGVEGSGRAMLEVSGTMLSFTLAAEGLLADAPHAAHIHYGEDAANACPPAEADSDGNGLLSTPEGVPFYGGIQVSLTTEGDTSPDSALAVDRFAVGPSIDYMRTEVPITEEIAQDILSGEVAVVVHGVDVNDNGTYDMEGAGPSPLDESLPAEATMPALCGVLAASVTGGGEAPPADGEAPPADGEAPAEDGEAPAEDDEEPQMQAPRGGVQTGAGSTAGVENAGLIAVGAMAVLGGAAMLARRRTAADHR